MNLLTDQPRLSDAFLIPQRINGATPKLDLGPALREAVASPILHPPLQQSVFAGDTVGIVLQQDLPHPREVVKALLDVFSESDIALPDITIVVAPRTAQLLGLPIVADATDQDLSGPPPLIPVEFGLHTVNFQIHDFDNAAGQAYLAANAAGQPVYVNRTLVEADFVLPVGSPLPGETQLTDCVYPVFSGNDAHQRYAEKDDSITARREEIQLANDMLGSFLVIQLVCGPGDEIREVVCGVRDQALETARVATNQLWKFPFTGTADAVLATIETENQTWEDFARAVTFAEHYVQSDGPILVWSSLATGPDREIKRVSAATFDDQVKLNNLPDLYRPLVDIFRQRSVYLRSQQSRSVVEGLGLGYFETTEELLRVVRPFESALMIRDAHRCQRSDD